MNGTDKKTKTPVVISGYGKERYINGKESGPAYIYMPDMWDIRNQLRLSL